MTKNIISGFRSWNRGIVPLNREVVLKKIPRKRESTENIASNWSDAIIEKLDKSRNPVESKENSGTKSRGRRMKVDPGKCFSG